jgi:hypothetical protein
MFDATEPLLLRGISLFHGWLPILLIWLVRRFGYDRRALKFQTIAGVILLLICYFGFAPPGTHEAGKLAVNINFVFGASDRASQTIMPPLGWLGILVVGIPVLMYWPTHLALKTIMRKKAHGAA